MTKGQPPDDGPNDDAMDSDSDGDDEKTALRSALVHAVGTICELERGERGLPMEPNAVPTMTFVLEQFVKVLAVDLSAFAKHAKRSAIGVDDVLLCARRNPELARALSEFVESNDLAKKKQAAPKKQQKKAPGPVLTTAAAAVKQHDFDDDFFDDDFGDFDMAAGRRRPEPPAPPPQRAGGFGDSDKENNSATGLF